MMIDRNPPNQSTSKRATKKTLTVVRKSTVPHLTTDELLILQAYRAMDSHGQEKCRLVLPIFVKNYRRVGSTPLRLVVGGIQP
jgi:hypothetical protein